VDGQSVNMIRDNSDYIELIKEHLEFGDFKSSSGLLLTWKLDIIKLLPEQSEMMEYLYPMYKCIGIETGGMLLALSVSGSFSGIIRKQSEGDQVYEPQFYYSRYNADSKKVITLVDDVVTTESSMKRAALVLHQHNIKVGEYLCILDRRPKEFKTLEITSLVTNQDLGLPAL